MARYVFIGAGAIGGALGGLLAEQGREALLVARGEHERAMRERGLTLRRPEGAATVPVATAVSPDGARLTADDVLVLTTKTHQAEAAVEQWADAPVHGASGEVLGHAAELLPILVALNGVAGEEIALRRFDRVHAVCVWFPTVMVEPGEIIVRTGDPRGIFHIGRYGAGDPALPAGLAEDWTAAGFRIVPTADVMRWKYRKLLSNLGNAPQALLGAVPESSEAARAAEAEGRAVLDAAGIAYTGDEEEKAGRAGFEILPVPGQPERIGGSSWQSLARGSGSIETAYLNGEIALLARRTGHPAPVNTALAALARRAARTGLRPGDIPPAELKEHLGL